MPYSRDTWYALREFETLDVITWNYGVRHKHDPKVAKAREIAASFNQAREYFTSAYAANTTVRPLLQYYGVATLSRGLVLFMSSGVRETDLKEGHGIGGHAWKNVLTSQTRDLGALPVKLKAGLFRHFLEVTGKSFYFRNNSLEVNNCLRVRPPHSDCEVTLEDIASRIPDIADQYAAWRKERPPFVPLVSVDNDYDNSQFEFALPKFIEGPSSVIVAELSEVGVEDIFPNNQCPNLVVDSSGSNIIVRYDPPFMPFLAQRFGQSRKSDIVLYPPLNSGEYFTPIALCFMLSYILGMICRYYPTIWVSLAHPQKGDAIYPFIIRAMDWIQEVYPLMVVDVLRGPYHWEKDA